MKIPVVEIRNTEASKIRHCVGQDPTTGMHQYRLLTVVIPVIILTARNRKGLILTARGLRIHPIAAGNIPTANTFLGPYL